VARKLPTTPFPRSLYKQPYHWDVSFRPRPAGLEAPPDLRILTTFNFNQHLLPRGYGEELQPKSTSVKSKTTLSREKVSKDEEHQKNKQDWSLKGERKAGAATIYSNRAMYRNILGEDRCLVELRCLLKTPECRDRLQTPSDLNLFLALGILVHLDKLLDNSFYATIVLEHEAAVHVSIVESHFL